MEEAGGAVGSRAALHGEPSAGGGNEEKDVFAVPAGAPWVLGFQLKELRRFQRIY